MATGFPQLDEVEGTVASYCGPALVAIEKRWEMGAGGLGTQRLSEMR